MWARLQVDVAGHSDPLASSTGRRSFPGLMPMVLRGLLSNPSFGDLLQCLASTDRHQDLSEDTVQEVDTRSGWPDGRRKFGTVSQAVVFVLSQTNSEMRLKTTLSQLVTKAAEGHEVIISSSGKPVAKLVAYSPARIQRKPGMLAGRIIIKPSFDDLPDGFDVLTR